jgi:xanthine dehydrogenase accessory factor
LLEKLVCPLGLPLGGNDPAEIAVSIVAQLIERRDQRLKV